ncbi:MAG: DUF1631 family protein [Casimicrobiaceae bacterium]
MNTPIDPNKIIASTRDLMLHRATLQLAAALDRLAEMLLDLASHTFDHRQVTNLLDARSVLLQERANLSDGFVRRMGERIDRRAAVAHPAEGLVEGALELQSVDLLDEQVAARALARNIESAALGDLPTLHQRIAMLFEKPALKLAEDPFSPIALVEALHEAMRAVCPSPAVRIAWLRNLGNLGGMGFTDIYRDLNRFLTESGVPEPIPAASAVRSAGGGGPAGAAAQANAQASARGTAGGNPTSVGEVGAAGEPRSANELAMTSMQSLVTNLMGLIERLQHVVPGIAGGPASVDPSLAQVVRAREAVQISAALGFGPAGATRGALPAAVDPQLMASLSALQTSFAQVSPDQLVLSDGLPGQAAGTEGSGEPASAPGRSILRSVVPGYATGDISVLDATTTELVAMLFDFAFARRELRDEVKVVIARLQIPTLKAAMIDRGFFSRKSHPARQLLNKLADAGMAWSPEDGPDDPLFRKISALVDQINRDFVDDLGVFTAAIVELEQFIAEQEQDARPAVEAELAEAQEADRQIVALKKARDAVEERLRQAPLPEPVREFIEVAWQPHLQDALLEEGAESAKFNEAVQTLDELIWSVTPKDQPLERAALGSRLPRLVKRLKEGLRRVSDDAVSPFMDKLFEIHSGLLRGSAPEYTPPPPAEPPAPVTEDVFTRIVAQMERNQWIEMSDENGALTFAKLAWISPQGTTYLFVTRHGRKAASLSPEELAEWFRTDRARIVESEPLVDRALAQMFAQEAKAA